MWDLKDPTTRKQHHKTVHNLNMHIFKGIPGNTYQCGYWEPAIHRSAPSSLMHQLKRTWQKQAPELKDTGITWMCVYNVAMFYITLMPFSSSVTRYSRLVPHHGCIYSILLPFFCKASHFCVLLPSLLSSNGIGKSGKLYCLLFPLLGTSVPEQRRCLWGHSRSTSI